MMTYSEAHILNGKALGVRIDNLGGLVIEMRECMIEGNVAGTDLHSVLASRMEFFQNRYDVTPELYWDKAGFELKKISQIPIHSSIHLWFEYDLFCQTNMWFVIWSLIGLKWTGSIYFVSPGISSWQGFAALTQAELKECMASKIRLSNQEIESFGQLWEAYQAADFTPMGKLAESVKHLVPPIKKVVQAHIDRFLPENEPGRPQRTLLQLTKRHPSESFAKIFSLFSQQEGIYGFGDLQVERMLRDQGITLSS